jgi:hypothetical protein
LKKGLEEQCCHFKGIFLSILQKGKSSIIFPAEKDFDQFIIERHKYIKSSMKIHLLDSTSYVPYTNSKNSTNFEKNKDLITKVDIIYLNVKCLKKLFPKLYTNAKIHKHPWTIIPIVSISDRILRDIGQWAEKILQPFSLAMPSYINIFATHAKTPMATIYVLRSNFPSLH